MSSMGTPMQWFNSIIDPSKWTDTTPFEKQTESLTLKPEYDPAVQAANAQAAKAKADAEAKAAFDTKTAADKIAADKAKSDKEAADAATLLATRRRASSIYATSGGAAGILGTAPVKVKTLLGQ